MRMCGCVRMHACVRVCICVAAFLAALLEYVIHDYKSCLKNDDRSHVNSWHDQPHSQLGYLPVHSIAKSRGILCKWGIIVHQYMGIYQYRFGRYTPTPTYMFYMHQLVAHPPTLPLD